MAANIRAWISASRPRTLPLAAASICMGGFLAFFHGLFDWTIFILTLSTTLLLQILSNLANDYGDHQHGADHHGRIGPARMVQSGNISPEKMKAAMVGLAGVTLLLGICLLIFSIGYNNPAFYIFMVLGLVCIAAAVNYTSGKKPYGYKGWGDLSVLIFFGLVAVFGSYFLQTLDFQWDNLLPAVSCGLFATAVLNINNIRDMESDKKAGKLSIPVRIGSANAIKYHWLLLAIALSCSVLFTILNYSSAWQWSFLVVIPLLFLNARAIQNHTGSALDPYLKQMVLTTLTYVITFGLGLVITSFID